MKKILTLFSALLLTVSMWGANEYNATINGDVTFTDLSYEMYGIPVYTYKLDFAQVGQTVGKTDKWNSDVCMILEPLEEGLAGTYTLGDHSMNSDSYVQYGSEERKVCDYTGKPTEIVITDNGNGSYTISGAFRTKIYKLDSKGKYNWFYYYYYFDATDPKNTFTPVAPDPYKDEPEKTTLSLTGKYIEAYDYMLASDGLVELDVYDEYYQQLTLGFMNDEYTIPAGDYEVANTGAKGTVLASKGMNGSIPYHSYFYDSDYSPYFIVGGSLTVSYSQDQTKMTVEGSLTTAHQTTLTFSVTDNNPFYVAPMPETYERSVTAGNYGTICLPRKFTEMTGVDGLFVPSYQDGGVLYCDEVALEDVQAGYAYIFKSNADEVTFTYDLNDVEESALLANYMRGWLSSDATLDDWALSLYEGYALLANNQIITPTAGSVIKKNRAMINLATVPSEAPQLAPNRRRVAFGTNVATGLEKAQGNMRTGKMMIKGNLILMKNGKKFNAQGAEL